MPMLAVLDASRSPPFASDVFGSCNADIVVGNRSHLALSVRSDGSAPDDVWFYDGRSLRKLQRQTREEHIRRGLAALTAGNMPDAARNFLAVADHGDPRGPFNLGEMARTGKGIEADEPLARDLLKRAAEMGHPGAMASLAGMLRDGKGGTSDRAGAVHWAHLAAEHGDGRGQLLLARTLRTDGAEPKDLDTALVWFRLAEGTLVGTPEATAARTEADEVAAAIGEVRAAAAAVRTAVFRPTPPDALWNLPADWSLWDGRHPLQRVRGANLLEMPAFAAPMRNLLGAPLYGRLPTLSSGPGGISVDADWVFIQACRAHSCNTDQYAVALRRDGSDAIACVLEPQTTRDQPRVPGLLTFARTGSPLRQREDTGTRGCPRSREELTTAAPHPVMAGRPFDRDAPVRASPTPPQRPEEGGGVRRPKESTGTAWRVAEAHFVTNAHVIEGCGSLRLSASKQAVAATVVARNATSDLALLQADLTTPASLSIRSTPPRPAEPVVVAGFPLRGLLAAGPQVSTGIVTALAGLQDDPTRIQISAPIQPGNSGGPVLDRSGQVIGVAASTIGTLSAAIVTGTVPQNVNFAISAERVSALLLSAGVQPDRTTAFVGTVEEVAARAMASVALVECAR